LKCRKNSVILTSRQGMNMSLSEGCVCMYSCEQLYGKNAYELKKKGKEHSSVHYLFKVVIYTAWVSKFCHLQCSVWCCKQSPNCVLWFLVVKPVVWCKEDRNGINNPSGVFPNRWA